MNSNLKQIKLDGLRAAVLNACKAADAAGAAWSFFRPYPGGKSYPDHHAITRYVNRHINRQVKDWRNLREDQLHSLINLVKSLAIREEVPS